MRLAPLKERGGLPLLVLGFPDGVRGDLRPRSLGGIGHVLKPPDGRIKVVTYFLKPGAAESD